jgi:hypothetical protein
MSELKFACPVCGQHITADSRASGTQLECPTCFRKLIVPQAGAQSDPKFVVTAAEVGKPREISTPFENSSGLPRRRPLVTLAVTSLFVGLAGLCAFGIYAYRGTIFSAFNRSSDKNNNSGHPGGHPAQTAPTVYPIPTNFSWTLDLTNTSIPQAPATGSIRSRGFYAERASITGGSLTLRQGRNWPPDLGVTVVVFARQAEDLSGKTVEIWTNRPAPLPQVILRWKADNLQPRTVTYTNNYAMKLVFGDAANGRMPGRLYLCLPDEPHSFIAGEFNAEIRKPQSQRPHPATTPAPPTPPAPQTKR